MWKHVPRAVVVDVQRSSLFHKQADVSCRLKPCVSEFGPLFKLRCTFLSHRSYQYPIMVLAITFSSRAFPIVTTEELLNSIILGRTEGFACDARLNHYLQKGSACPP